MSLPWAPRRLPPPFLSRPKMLEDQLPPSDAGIEGDIMALEDAHRDLDEQRRRERRLKKKGKERGRR
ncbi:hypothetical protein PR202_gb26000 [Eleusine coracana subsp. coracana]|uniref:Uncharacterized protein n=1 Tax=Eleusine coracana subsp. coracana TaxID=191504 RepID=A0AAV5FMU5_ELECO|nr:hypothetical protein PR202_gb26000 [Eleusine coracana subsp. coracana]